MEFDDLEIGHVLDPVQPRQSFQDSLEADDSIVKVSLTRKEITILVQVRLRADLRARGVTNRAVSKGSGSRIIEFQTT
jgi:hypothetical protein